MKLTSAILLRERITLEDISEENNFHKVLSLRKRELDAMKGNTRSI